MKTKHTPGPWRADVRKGFTIDILHDNIEKGAITKALCKVQARESWADEAEANARLIAAAPDIAEQLDRCVRFLADLNGCNWIPGDSAGCVDMRQRAKALQRTAFAAITKATREST